MSDVAEILNQAADLLEKPGAWTQGAYGRDASGEPIPEWHERCTCWCAAGAVWAVLGKGASTRDLEPALDVLARDLPRRLVSEWNDEQGRTQSEVVEALRQAARQAQG